ncbi:PREDICTED: THO complex subunit 1-like [Amphimedon queenslandica]|uniref:THO complex subunit 1 n=1 Tax=Amphimedon queenslandica TaxID=400682 RepID=A0A1X7VU87_AMPQE|nr:PREDICTED: THO complex subunit 1-like [Amphimedon queenslandica]|eukprot:XP_003382878.1 PREDICTED: THO complex subunit 1-like [Amphimedon queenslandica]
MASSETRSRFAQSIHQTLKNGASSPSLLQEAFGKASGNDNDKKSIFEQSFRDVLRDLIAKDPLVSSFSSLVSLSVLCAESQICYHSVPFLLLSDAFDCITLDFCEKLFDTVESHVTVWTKQDFFSSGRILLLRMCNDLLRRLSSSLNTVFCGRIQLFLARLFPLSEKSALNLMSHFNLENVTSFKTLQTPPSSSEPQKPPGGNTNEDGEDMEIDALDQETGMTPVDYNLYEKLWTLQDFFRHPVQCFHSDRWKKFTGTVQEVLQSFSSYKLEDIQSKRRKLQSSDEGMDTLSPYTSSHYFTKYLTSENLLSLQLSDSHFRRHVLIQFLILFQYLTGDVKFKNSSQVLSESHSSWVTETTSKVYQLLEETPPDGKSFAEYVKLVIQREETWIAWKNGGCPSFEKTNSKPPNRGGGGDTKERLGERLFAMKEEKDMGSKELSRLWNLCPDNLESCSSPERIFVPPLEIFLEEPLEEMKPNCEIPKEDRWISNPNFRWQALRLLSCESTHFFPIANQSSMRPLEEYLDHVILQTSKEF